MKHSWSSPRVCCRLRFEGGCLRCFDSRSRRRMPATPPQPHRRKPHRFPLQKSARTPPPWWPQLVFTLRFGVDQRVWRWSRTVVYFPNILRCLHEVDVCLFCPYVNRKERRRLFVLYLTQLCLCLHHKTTSKNFFFGSVLASRNLKSYIMDGRCLGDVWGHFHSKHRLPTGARGPNQTGRSD